MNYQLKSDQKLLNKQDFDRVFSFRQRNFFDLFVAYHCRNDFQRPRLGIVVSKRNAKKAVDRNRVKRVIRESFRLCKSELPNNDYVICLRNMSSVNKTELRKSVDLLWKRSKTPV